MGIFFKVKFLYFGGKFFFPSICFAFSVAFPFFELSIFTLKKSCKCIQLKAKSMKLSQKSGNWDVHKVYSSLLKTMLDDFSFGRFSVVGPLLHLKMSLPQQIRYQNLSFLETLLSAALLQLYFLTDFFISYQTKKSTYDTISSNFRKIISTFGFRFA